MVKIWIDLDNTPHVPFFIPIIEELRRRGYQVVLTARDAFQVCQLADDKGLPYTKIGRHYGRNPVMKILGLLWRSAQMVPFCLGQRPALALSHGSRSQVLLGNLLRIPTVLTTDYEYGRALPLARSRWLVLPEALKDSELLRDMRRVRYYRGIKEDVYVPYFKPDPSILDHLGLSSSDIVVAVRPPASEAHYHVPASDDLLCVLMARIGQTPGLRAVLLPRNAHQAKELREGHPEWFVGAKTVIPAGTVDGLSLLWFSDVIVSGGGTMNREAAALGIPVYSIFRGKTGAVDRRLEREGRLIMIRDAQDVWERIRFVARDKTGNPEVSPKPALADIVGHVEAIIQQEKIKDHKR
jgi:hypothetical protein